MDEMKPPDPPRKTFASIVAGGKTKSKIEKKEISIFKGEPAVFFSEEEIKQLAEPFKFALVGKFPKGRPSMEAIRGVFAKLNLKAEYKIGLIDSNHILIHLHDEEDYHRIWLRTQWNIFQFPMLVSKWHVNFTPDNESSIIPIWISMPYLPAHLFDQDAIEVIAKIVGTPMRVDLSTATLSRPSKARVCVEVDVSKNLPNRGWVGQGKTGFWQDFIYEYVPDFCSKCNKIGHNLKTCIVYGMQDRNETITNKITAQNKAGEKARNIITHKQLPSKKQIYILKKGETMVDGVIQQGEKAEGSSANENKVSKDKQEIGSSKEGQKITDEDEDTYKENPEADRTDEGIQSGKGTPACNQTDDQALLEPLELNKRKSCSPQSEEKDQAKASQAKTTEDLPDNTSQIHRIVSSPDYDTDGGIEIQTKNSETYAAENHNEDITYSSSEEEGNQAISEHSININEGGNKEQEEQFKLVTRRKNKRPNIPIEQSIITRSAAKGTQTNKPNQAQ